MIRLTTAIAATYQDHGRATHNAVGVPTSGPLDRLGHDTARWLTGDTPNTIETFGPLAGDATAPISIAWVGDHATVTINHRTAPTGHILHLQPGDHLNITPNGPGVGYLATTAGWDTPATLDSAATDTLSGLGPRPLRPGDTITPRHTDHAPAPRAATLATPGHVIGTHPGPHADHHDAYTQALASPWTVASLSRTGIHLTRDTPVSATPTPIDSYAMLDGAIQLLPDGTLVVLGPDHGTLGGYPVIAVTDPEGLAALAHIHTPVHLAAGSTRPRDLTHLDLAPLT